MSSFCLQVLSAKWACDQMVRMLRFLIMKPRTQILPWLICQEGDLLRISATYCTVGNMPQVDPSLMSKLTLFVDGCHMTDFIQQLIIQDSGP